MNVTQNIFDVTDNDFDASVLQSEGVFLVDFWAPWCSPCKMIAPILEEIAIHYGDRLKIAKINIDENQETPQKYSVRGIPTLMIFKNGENFETKVGAIQKSQLISILDNYL